MKKITYAAIASLALLLVSCSEVDKLLTFKMSNSTTFKIEPTAPINLDYVVTTPISTSSTEFSNNNTKAELIKSVKLEEVKLTITDPTDKTFSFLKSAHLYISTNATDEIEIAAIDDVNTTSNSIIINLKSTNLTEYIKASSCTIKAKVILKESITKTITVKADFKYSATADPFK